MGVFSNSAEPSDEDRKMIARILGGTGANKAAEDIFPPKQLSFQEAALTIRRAEGIPDDWPGGSKAKLERWKRGNPIKKGRKK